MAGVPLPPRVMSMKERETRFRNETEEALVKCLFCQQMLPKAYEQIQAHVDAFHKEKKAVNHGGGGVGGGGVATAGKAAATKVAGIKKVEKCEGQIGGKNTKKQRRKRVRQASPSANDEENEVDGALRSSQPSNRYFCQICSRGFNFPHRLVGHLELVHKRFDVGDENHVCDICQREFKFARLVENHLHSHHSGVLYSCLACSTTFSVAQHLDAHMAKKHECLSYSCKLCSKLFFNTYDLQTHVDVSHQFEANDAFLFCRKCGRNFAFISALEKHEQTHNATAKNDNMQMTICLPALPKGFLLSMNDRGIASASSTSLKKPTTVKRSASPSVSSSPKTCSSLRDSLSISRSTPESSLNTDENSHPGDKACTTWSSKLQLSSTSSELDPIPSSSARCLDTKMSAGISTLKSLDVPRVNVGTQLAFSTSPSYDQKSSSSPSKTPPCPTDITMFSGEPGRDPSTLVGSVIPNLTDIPKTAVIATDAPTTSGIIFPIDPLAVATTEFPVSPDVTSPKNAAAST